MDLSENPWFIPNLFIFLAQGSQLTIANRTYQFASDPVETSAALQKVLRSRDVVEIGLESD